MHEILHIKKKVSNFAPTKGEMLEWLKRHAWKACIGQKPIPGSNPGLSAKNEVFKERWDENPRVRNRVALGSAKTPGLSAIIQRFNASFFIFYYRLKVAL